MKEYVFAVSSGDYEKLKKILESDPYADDSFAKNGYTLRDSTGLGLEAGKYVLYYRAREEMGEKLKKKLTSKAEEKLEEIIKGKNLGEEQKQAILKGLKEKELAVHEVEGHEKEKIIKKIKEDEDSAAAGFGSIFG